MGIALTILIALAAGGIWALALRGLRQRRRLIPAPRAVSAALRAYTAGRWDVVIRTAPACLEGVETPGDAQWRPALELALGHALVQRDRCQEAIGHLERGLLLQAARRRAEGGGDEPTAAEAKMRHMLGYALASTGQRSAARREYDRVLRTDGIEPSVRARVEAARRNLDDGV